MKKLVYVMMAFIAMSFAACNTNSGEKSEAGQDTITNNVETVQGDTVAEGVETVAAETSDATADADTPVEKPTDAAENK